MSGHVALNLLNELGKDIKCDACRAFCLPSILSFFRNKLNKFSNTGALVLDSMYPLMLKVF